jgi:hypothetical protein
MTDIDKAIEEAKASVMPFECWEQLPGETGKAYSAFCVFRDCGPERSIRMAVESNEKDETKREKRYRVWRNWCSQYRWRERAADFDRYMEKLKQTDHRKTIEAQGEMHRKVTGKMLEVVNKKLDLMDASELTQGNVTEWVQTAIRAEREAGQFAEANCLGVSASRNPTLKQGELSFVPDFEGL